MKKVGRMYSLDLNDKMSKIKEIVLKNLPENFKFTPHGIDAFETDRGKTLIYIVNHGSFDVMGEQEKNNKFNIIILQRDLKATYKQQKTHFQNFGIRCISFTI